MQRSTLALGALVLVAMALILLDRPSPAPSTSAGPLAPGAQLPEGHPPLNGAAVAPAAAAAGPFATVLETMDSGGYTYARVETDGAEIWVAGPETPLSDGDQVSLAGGMGMEGFHAASLDRTFDRILFLNAFQTRAGGAAASVPAAPSSGSAAAASGTVLEVIHAAGYSYLRVDVDGEEMWLAGTQLPVEEGQTAAWNGGALMQGFASPTLNRTFDRILFAEGLRVDPGR